MSINELQSKLIAARTIHTKFQSDLRHDIRILVKLAHISKLRRDDYSIRSRSSTPIKHNQETKKIQEDLATVLARIQTLSEVVVEKNKLKEDHVKTMATDMERNAAPINPNDINRKECWAPHRINPMSFVLQRGYRVTKLIDTGKLNQEELKLGKLRSTCNVNNQRSKFGVNSPNSRKKRRSQLLASAHRLALGIALQEEVNEKEEEKEDVDVATVADVGYNTAAAARTYTKAVVIASAGALRCVECHSGEKSLQTDTDEDGRKFTHFFGLNKQLLLTHVLTCFSFLLFSYIYTYIHRFIFFFINVIGYGCTMYIFCTKRWSPLTEKFLYCEGCWADFYKEKFDGTRLSSINFRMSDL